MEKDTNKEYINVLTDTGKTALLLFFMACCKEGEGDNVEVTPQNIRATLYMDIPKPIK